MLSLKSAFIKCSEYAKISNISLGLGHLNADSKSKVDLIEIRQSTATGKFILDIQLGPKRLAALVLARSDLAAIARQWYAGFGVTELQAVRCPFCDNYFQVDGDPEMFPRELTCVGCKKAFRVKQVLSYVSEIMT